MSPRSKTSAPAVPRVVAYLRLSTPEQADSRTGLDAQHSAIQHEVKRRGWLLRDVLIDKGVSGKSLKGRAQLDKALRLVEAGEAEVLMVAKLDSLSRSLLDVASLMSRAQSKGWNLVALDLGIDLSTPAGEFVASVMVSAAQAERRILGKRTRDALAAKKAAGVRLGRRSTLPDEVVARIRTERSKGATLAAIAEALTEDGVLTGQGGRRWYPSSVRAVLESDRPGPARGEKVP